MEVPFAFSFMSILMRLLNTSTSHYHNDHTGDMSTFPSTTELVIHEDTDVRTYPSKEDSLLLESDFAYVFRHCPMFFSLSYEFINPETVLSENFLLRRRRIKLATWMLWTTLETEASIF